MSAKNHQAEGVGNGEGERTSHDAGHLGAGAQKGKVWGRYTADDNDDGFWQRGLMRPVRFDPLFAIFTIATTIYVTNEGNRGGDPTIALLLFLLITFGTVVADILYRCIECFSRASRECWLGRLL